MVSVFSVVEPAKPVILIEEKPARIVFINYDVVIAVENLKNFLSSVIDFC